VWPHGTGLHRRRRLPLVAYLVKPYQFPLRLDVTFCSEVGEPQAACPSTTLAESATPGLATIRWLRSDSFLPAVPANRRQLHRQAYPAPKILAHPSGPNPAGLNATYSISITTKAKGDMTVTAVPGQHGHLHDLSSENSWRFHRASQAGQILDV